MSPVEEAIARHKIAQAANDASLAAGNDAPELGEAEFDALDELAEAPCANHAEFISKLKYLLEYETELFGCPFDSLAEFVSVARASAAYFEGSASALSSRRLGSGQS